MATQWLFMLMWLEPFISRGSCKLFSSSVWRSINPHCGWRYVRYWGFLMLGFFRQVIICWEEGWVHNSYFHREEPHSSHREKMVFIPFRGGKNIWPVVYIVVVLIHTVVVCFVKGGGGGGGLLNMGPWKLFSSSIFRSINPHSGFLSLHSGFLC